jgi:hypothetical protein
VTGGFTFMVLSVLNSGGGGGAVVSNIPNLHSYALTGVTLLVALIRTSTALRLGTKTLPIQHYIRCNLLLKSVGKQVLG